MSPPLNNFPLKKILSTKLNNTLLLTSGVNVSWLSKFLRAAEQTGESFSFVSLYRNENLSSLIPHFCLSDAAEQRSPPNIIVIPAGEKCYKRLLVDPRVHLYLKRVVKNSGTIVFAKGAELYLNRVPFNLRIPANQLIFQRGKSTAEFAYEIFG